MPTNPLQARPDAGRWPVSAARDADDAVGLGWWLSGGASLLVWTGFALLLTTA